MTRSGSTPPTPAPSTPPGRRGGLMVNWATVIGTGVVLGAIVGALVHALGPAVPEYGTGTSALFFAALGTLLGGLLAAVVGVVVDSVLARRRG